jgi:hypothetical protein
VFVSGAAAQQTRAETKAGPDGPSLKLVITSSRRQVELNGSFDLEAKLVNVGAEPVSLFGQLLWGYHGGLTIHVWDQRGKPVEAGQYDEDMVVPTVLGNPESYVVLLPDHFLGISRKESSRNLFRKPGVYWLFVEYRSPVPERYAKTPAFWGRAEGSIRSSTIRVEVVGR